MLCRRSSRTRTTFLRSSPTYRCTPTTLLSLCDPQLSLESGRLRTEVQGDVLLGARVEVEEDLPLLSVEQSTFDTFRFSVAFG